MAQIGWIDFSPEHRERVSAVLDLLKPEGVVDELGIGSVRDSFSDQIFPGISTIQTRAKYFFIIPYILYEYQLLPSGKQGNKSPEKYLEEREYEVMWALADKYDHKDGCGVIGITKYRPEKIMRRPSAIYWNGLSFFGLIRHGGLGVNSFLRSRVGSVETLIAKMPDGDDVARDDADVDYTNQFNLKLPFNQNWAEQLTLDLTLEEADLLSHRMREAGRGTILGSLLENMELFKTFKSIDLFADFAKFVAVDKDLDQHIREILINAHDFSELMYGAHISYNCLLQKNKFQNNAYSDQWTEWIRNIKKNMIDYTGFSPDTIFGRVHRVRNHTRQFVYDWWSFIKSSNPSIKKRDEMIEKQEFNTKLVKARVRQGNYDDVHENKWIGLEKLEYRMSQAKRIIQDVFDGKKRA